MKGHLGEELRKKGKVWQVVKAARPYGLREVPMGEELGPEEMPP